MRMFPCWNKPYCLLISNVMNIKEIRKLVTEGGSVVLLEEGHPPLIVRELSVDSSTEKAVREPEEEVQISSKWPKRSEVMGVPTGEAQVPKQDLILERLNKEILALKAQIAEEEQGISPQDRSH